MSNLEHLITADFNNMKTGLYALDSMFKHVNGSHEFDWYLEGQLITMEFHNLPMGQTIRFIDMDNHEKNVVFKRHVTEWNGHEVIGASDWQVEPRQAVYDSPNLQKEDQAIQLLIEIRDLLQALGEKR